MPVVALTDGPVQVGLLAGVASMVVPARQNRSGLLLANGTASAIFVDFGGVDPTAQKYSWRLAPGDQWAVPQYGIAQELRAFCVAAIALGGGFCVTEFYVP